MPPVNTGGHKEVTKTKAQLEEEKKVCLSLRIKPIDLEGAQQRKNDDAGWWIMSAKGLKLKSKVVKRDSCCPIGFKCKKGMRFIN